MNSVIQQLEAFPLVLQQDVIWGDLDAYGHVNNTVYFRYFEDARMAYFDQVGVSEYKNEQQKGPILASTRCDFRQPLQYPGRIHIAARCTIEGPRKIRMDYAVYSEQHEAIAGEGEALVIFYDYAEGRSCPIPSFIEAAIVAFEQESVAK